MQTSKLCKHSRETSNCPFYGLTFDRWSSHNFNSTISGNVRTCLQYVIVIVSIRNYCSANISTANSTAPNFKYLHIRKAQGLLIHFRMVHSVFVSVAGSQIEAVGCHALVHLSCRPGMKSEMHNPSRGIQLPPQCAHYRLQLEHCAQGFHSLS